MRLFLIVSTGMAVTWVLIYTYYFEKECHEKNGIVVRGIYSYQCVKDLK